MWAYNQSCRGLKIPKLSGPTVRYVKAELFTNQRAMIVGIARIETVPRSALAVSNLPSGSRRSLTSADLAGNSLFQTGSVNLTQVRNRAGSRPGQLHLIHDSGVRVRTIQNFGINKHLFHGSFPPWDFYVVARLRILQMEYPNGGPCGPPRNQL